MTNVKDKSVPNLIKVTGDELDTLEYLMMEIGDFLDDTENAGIKLTDTTGKILLDIRDDLYVKTHRIRKLNGFPHLLQ
ncbi:hypothetical protein BEH94_00230 [Candidatus Altiarchaeales archaeon WOR_SM1_SCG]|nr:hypothetical protein BEH94_00230 [Candidatus Altiarchaeales archaeon WOR_SM1_SCG]